MAESRQPRQALSDEALAEALRDLGGSVAFPSPGDAPDGADVATRARVRILALGIHPSPARGPRWFGGMRPMRRGLVLAVAALLLLAAIATAIGLGLPGLRIFFGDVPSQSPVASPTGQASLGTLGSSLGLGTARPLAEVERLSGLDLVLPPNPAVGPPDVAYLAGERVALVWAERDGLPATGPDGIGLLLSEFRGRVESGYYSKILDGGSKLTPVTVNGSRGYWISGDPHFFYYIGPDGESVDDTHRVVGDTLIWSTGEMTYRLESGLGMEGAISLAESLE